MVALFLLVLFLAYGQPFWAKAFGPLPEPQIFYNLTRAEFDAKLSAYRATHHHISKRVAIGMEESNYAHQQSIIEQRTGECAIAFGRLYRALHGGCWDDGKSMRWYCGRTDDHRARLKPHRKECKGTEKTTRSCEFMPITNYMGQRADLPYCADTFTIDTSQHGDTFQHDDYDVSTIFEGHTSIPDEPMASDALDTYWQIDTLFADPTGHFVYLGRLASGGEFRSESPKVSHSWGCFGCPPGTLSIQTIGHRADAYGFVLPAGSYE